MIEVWEFLALVHWICLRHPAMFLLSFFLYFFSIFCFSGKKKKIKIEVSKFDHFVQPFGGKKVNSPIVREWNGESEKAKARPISTRIRRRNVKLGSGMPKRVTWARWSLNEWEKFSLHFNLNFMHTSPTQILFGAPNHRPGGSVFLCKRRKKKNHFVIN